MPLSKTEHFHERGLKPDQLWDLYKSVHKQPHETHKHTLMHSGGIFMCVYLGVFLYKGGYPGCFVESPFQGVKGKDIVNKSKFLAGLRIEWVS